MPDTNIHARGTPIVGTAVGAVAAFTDLTGEATADPNRKMQIVCIKASAAGAASFALRKVTAAGAAVALWPESGGLKYVGDGVRHVIDATVWFEVLPGEHLEWIKAEAVAGEIAVLWQDCSERRL